MNFSIEESKENDLIFEAATGNIKTWTIRNLLLLLTLQAVRINNQAAPLLGLAKSIDYNYCTALWRNVDTNVEVILMGKFYDLKAVKDNAGIWIVFCMGRSFQVLSSALSGYISMLSRGHVPSLSFMLSVAVSQLLHSMSLGTPQAAQAR